MRIVKDFPRSTRLKIAKAGLQLHAMPGCLRRRQTSASGLVDGTPGARPLRSVDAAQRVDHQCVHHAVEGGAATAKHAWDCRCDAAGAANEMNARLLLSCLFALCAFAAHGGEVYKWTDAQGRVHYSQSPPDGAPVQVVPVQPSPSPSPAPVPPAPQTRQPRQASGPPAEVAADVPPEPLPGRPGPLPEKQVSEYLSTLATLMNVNASPPLYNFSITVRVRADVPVGAVLVAAFEDPAAAGRFLRTTGRVVMTSDYPQKIKDEILLGSPTFSEVRCRNYAVVIRLYRDEQSSTPMGTHRQLIQSRVDSRLLRANPGSITRLIDAGHVCP